MKRVIFSMVIILLYLNSGLLAQTERGNWLVGGSASFYNNKYDTQLRLNPKAGYFIAKNLAIGIELSYLNYKFKPTNITYNSIGVGTFLRYYFLGNEKGKFFTEASYSVSKQITENMWTNYYTAGLGYSYFINKNVALEVSANVGQGKYSPRQFGLQIGFQIHF